MDDFLVPAELNVDTLEGQLLEQLDASAQASESLRRSFLDTVDWRLWRQGLSLELSARGRRMSLELTRLDDGELLARAPVERAPRFSWDLPPNRLRKVLAPVLELRALLPRVVVKTRRRRLHLLNRDGKITHRLDVDRNTLDGRRLATRVRSRELTGYDKTARRTRRVLRGSLKLRGQNRPLLGEALLRAGIDPGATTPNEPVLMQPDERADITLKRALTALLRTMQASEAGILEDIDTECLHDFRVALRRTRSALQLAKGVFPSARVRRFRGEFGWLGRVTGGLRDLDVYLLDFDDYRALLGEAVAPGLEPLRSTLERERKHALGSVRAALSSARYRQLVQRWEAFLQAPVPRRSVLDKATRPTLEVANKRIWKAYKRVLRDGRRIDRHTPEGRLHHLRKRCKYLRYIIEMYISLYSPAGTKKALGAVKTLQDNLGRVQDFSVQAETLTAYDEVLQDEPAATHAAVGALVEKLQKRQRRARREFTARFAAFDTPATHRRMRTLFRPAKP